MSQWIQQRLFSYSFEIEQWAYAVSKTMLDRVSKADYDTWLKVGQKVGLETRKKLKAVEPIYKRLQAEQVRLITSLPIDSAKKVQEWVTEGLDKGQRYSEIVDRIQSKLADENRNHAILIARTETARCRSHFTEARARNVGSTHYIWRTVGDGTVRELHRKNNGQIFAWTDPPIAGVGRGGQPVLAHAGQIYNCFTGNTPVIVPNDLRKVIRAPFDGRVIDISAGSALISATPNHPMLTQRGWVSASELREGDYLLKPFRDTVEMIEPNVNDVVTTFDQLFDTVEGEKVTALGLHFNFYGDIPNGDVDATIVKRSLALDGQAKGSESLSNLSFARTSGVMVGVEHNVTDMSVSGVLGESLTLLESHSLISKGIGLASVTDCDCVLFQALANGCPINSEMLGEGKDAFTGVITAKQLGDIDFLPIMGFSAETEGVSVDSQITQFVRENIGTNADSLSRGFNCEPLLYKGFRIKNLVSRNFSGHVYTLETDRGWYGVSPLNFTTKNCRCWAEPIFPDEEG